MTSSPFTLPPRSEILALAVRTVQEDVGSGDLTASLIDPQITGVARLVCREAAVLCGSAWATEVCNIIDTELNIDWHCEDGGQMTPSQTVCSIHGRARSILTAERSMINLLQTLSATATVTRDYVMALEGRATRILDTRKTIPGMRLAQKYAVVVGGGVNHRIGLFDGVLIKENHIAAAGSIRKAIEKVSASAAQCPLIEVEVESIAELEEALDAGVSRIMLDNFSIELMKEAVDINGGRAELEVSGNVGLDDVARIAATGVDFISIGALTKHISAVDFSLRMQSEH